jgi:hypothetical protein
LRINHISATDVVSSIEGEEEQDQSLSTYDMFKYSIRSELTQKYYERRIRKFLDFIQFEIEIKEIGKRCNDFAEKGKDNINWTISQINRFLHFQKERVERNDITSIQKSKRY